MCLNQPCFEPLPSGRVFKIINMRTTKPVIGVPADRRLLGHHWFHAAGEKYLRAVADAAAATPVIVPAFGDELELEALVDRFDGLLLTGSPSNVEPHRYAGPPSVPGTLHDPHRDATTLPLIAHAVDAAVPLLAICRGFQEMNVAFGGTLHQRIHELPGHRDHREDDTQPVDVQYGPAHEVALEPGGLFERLANGVRTIRVNSLHSQGVDRLAPGLVVEARAPDGIVEAFRVANAPTFAVGVQWHPEWKAMDNEFSRALFAEFGEAARRRAARSGAAGR